MNIEITIAMIISIGGAGLWAPSDGGADGLVGFGGRLVWVGEDGCDDTSTGVGYVEIGGCWDGACCHPAWR